MKYDIILSWIIFILIFLLEVITNYMQPFTCCRQSSHTLSSFIVDFLQEIAYKYLTEIQNL